MTVDQFILEITRPLYVYRMAKANEQTYNAAHRASAQTRMKNAKKEIQQIVAKYAQSMDDYD